MTDLTAKRGEGKQTTTKTEFRNVLAQKNFDFRVWNCRNLSESDLLIELYRFGFTRSEAKRAITFIYNQTEKALKENEK